MNGLGAIEAINTWAASPECKRIVEGRKKHGEKEPGSRQDEPFTLQERGGKTYCIFADGSERPLGK